MEEMLIKVVGRETREGAIMDQGGELEQQKTGKEPFQDGGGG